MRIGRGEMWQAVMELGVKIQSQICYYFLDKTKSKPRSPTAFSFMK